VPTREGSIGSSSRSKEKKMHSLVAQALSRNKKKRSAIIYGNVFFIYIGSVLAILSVLMGVLLISMNTVKENSNILETSFLRQDSMMRLYRFARIKRGIFSVNFLLSANWTRDIAFVNNGLLLHSNELLGYNKFLYSSLGQVEDVTKDILIL